MQTSLETTAMGLEKQKRRTDAVLFRLQRQKAEKEARFDSEQKCGVKCLMRFLSKHCRLAKVQIPN